MADVLDLHALDRDVKKAARRVDDFRGLLATGTEEARRRGRGFDVFGELRHTASMSTYRALGAMSPSALDVPLRDGLRRWVYELLQVRVGLDLELAEADALHAVDGRLPAGRAAEAKRRLEARRGAGVAPEPRLSSVLAMSTYRDAWEAVVTAADAAHAAMALELASELALPVAAVRKERRARRFEAARRLGLRDPSELATKLDVRTAARTFLDESEPLAVELLKIARKTSDTAWLASSAIQHALAREANDGWPAHLVARWLDDSFGALALRGRGIDAGPLPRPLGGASFLRAALAWGSSLRRSGPPPSMPFAVAHDPYSVAAFRYGFALASVVAGIPFQRRALGLPMRTAEAQSRVLHSSMLIGARTIAAQTLLDLEEGLSPSTFEEITSRVFGAPLPHSMRDAWPDPTVSPSKLEGLLGTLQFCSDLVQRYDEDWYRNPRAGRHLVSLACGPAFDDEPAPPGAPSELARAFEKVLG